MAPPKSAEKAAYTAKPGTEVKKKRVYVRRNVKIKPEKPKLKVPTIIKIKIPNPKFCEASSVSVAEPEINSSPMRKKLVSNEAKIQMANEVLKTILTKSNTSQADKLSADSTAVSSNRKILKEPVKRRGRKKASPEEVAVEEPEQNICEVESEVLKTILTKSNSSQADKPSVDSTAVSPNRKIPKGPVKRRGRKNASPEEVAIEEPEQNICEVESEVLKTILTKSNSSQADKPSVDSTAVSPNRKIPKGPVKRRGRKNASPEEVAIEEPEQNSCEAESEELFECPQPKKKNVAKKLKEVKKQIENEVSEVPSPTKKVCKSPVKKQIKNVPVKPAALPKVKATPGRKPKVKNDSVPVKKSTRLRKNNDDNNPTAINDIAAKIENNISEEKPSQPVPVLKPTIANGETTDSRRTSMSSNLSWTKDISSSSTTTCYTVRTDDFFRIDKKLPIVELKKIDNQTTTSDTSSSSSSDSSSSTSDTDEHTSEIVSTCDLKGGRSPNLSISSISRVGSSPKQKTYPDEDINTFEKALKALDKVKLMMNNLNLEILSWIGEKPISINPKTKSREKIIDQLRQENDIAKLYKQCENKINKQNTTDTSKDHYHIQTENESLTYTDKNIDFTSDVISGNLSDQSSPTKRSNNERYNYEENDIDNGEYRKREAYRKGTQYSDNMRSDESDNSDYEDTRYRNDTRACDDDDALSLFAEGSIIGGESYRYNSSVASIQYDKNNESEEYVPQPLSTHISPTACYQPSKIQNNSSYNGDCPKNDIQDSRRIDDEVFKLPNRIQKTHSVQINKYNNQVLKNNIDQRTKPVLMSSIYKWMRGDRKSAVFKDVCFFNLVKVCNRENCSFPHAQVPINELKIRLVRLSEEVFIKEYMVARTWDELRRIYGLCFVEECARRELTNILIEMCIDFITRTNRKVPNDIQLKVAVIETVLLHLNKVDLTTCKDLLTYNLGPKEFLCDVFMKAIAETQNFSRFKLVFINLTNFILGENRDFAISVAESILERVAILPCEEPVARALIKILNKTDKKVLQNPMLPQFEAQLKSLNTELFKELQIVKLQSLMTQNVVDTMSPILAKVAEDNSVKGLNNEQNIGLSRQISTEITNQDAMNQMTDQTLARAPVDHSSRTQNFTITNNYAASPSSDESNFRHSAPNERFKQWRDTSFNSPVFGARNRARPWLRGQNKRRFDQRAVFGATPPKFPRRF